MYIVTKLMEGSDEKTGRKFLVRTNLIYNYDGIIISFPTPSDAIDFLEKQAGISRQAMKAEDIQIEELVIH